MFNSMFPNIIENCVAFLNSKSDDKALTYLSRNICQELGASIFTNSLKICENNNSNDAIIAQQFNMCPCQVVFQINQV